MTEQRRSKSIRSAVLSLLSVALLGLVLWLAVAKATGKNEAWDHPSYFFLAVPLLAVGCGAAAFISPQTKFLAGIAAVSLQFLWLLWQSPEGSWPLALIGGGISFGAVAVLCTFASIIVGTIRQHSLERHIGRD